MDKIKFTEPLKAYNTKTKDWEVPKTYYCELCKDEFIKNGGGWVDLQELHNQELHK